MAEAMLLCMMMACIEEDEEFYRISQERTAAKKKKAKKTQATSQGQPAKHLKADSKRLRVQEWLRLKLRCGCSTTTKITKTATQASPAHHSSAPRPPERIRVLQPVIREQPTILDASPPPAYDDQGALPPLYVGLPRELETRVLQVADQSMTKAHAVLAPLFDLATLTAISAAVRDGCISAAATVSKASLQKTVAELNDIVDEGCHRAARAVIAAVAAAPERTWIDIANSTAKVIMWAAKHHVQYNKQDPMPYAASAQLISTVYSVAATITLRVLNGNPVLDDIPLPAREEPLPGP